MLTAVWKDHHYQIAIDGDSIKIYGSNTIIDMLDKGKCAAWKK